MDENPYASPQEVNDAPTTPQDSENEFRPVEAHFVWTVNEYLTACKYHYRQTVRPFFHWGLNVVFFVLTVTMGLVVYDRPTLFGFILIFALVLLLLRRLLLRIVLVLTFRSNLHRNSDVARSFTEEKMVSDNTLGGGHIKWEGIVKWCETPIGFLTYLNRNHLLWTPFSAFQSEADIAAVRELAKRKLGDEKCKIVK